MKFNAQYVIPIVILVMVVIVSLCDSCRFFMPYDSEGYDNINMPLGTGDANYSGEKLVNAARSDQKDSDISTDGSMNMSRQIATSGPMPMDNSMPMGNSMPMDNSMPMGNSMPMDNSMAMSNSLATRVPMSMTDAMPMFMNDTMGTPIPDSYKTISQAASAPSIRTTFEGRESFANLNDASSEYASNDKTVDIYSEAKGGLSCEPSPYSNSMGYLCLDDKQQEQLKTRGGNQTIHH